MALQRTVDDDAFDAVDDPGHAPGRVADVAALLRPARPEAAHHTRQTLGPVAGPEGLAGQGDALDENFLGGGRNHGCCKKREVHACPGQEGLPAALQHRILTLI